MEMGLKILKAAYQMILYVSWMESAAVCPGGYSQKMSETSPVHVPSAAIRKLERSTCHLPKSAVHVINIDPCQIKCEF